MIELELRYVAHITTLTGLTKERCRTDAGTLRALIDELETRYAGFYRAFVNSETGGLNLNAMIYYCDAGQTPLAVVDLDHPLKDGGVVTFW
jgi:molybdopterin converting factor small subunit